MTLEQAYKMLNTDTGMEELEEFLGKNYSYLCYFEAMRRAKKVACECIKWCMEMEDDGK